jgi:hypothetical protein
MRIDAILAELAKHAAEHELWPKAAEKDVATTEAAIGLRLPESYRQFVIELSNGAYLFMCQEVSAVGDGNRQIGPIQGVFHRIWTAARSLSAEELAADVPFREGGTTQRKYLIPFSLDHNGNQWCFVAEQLGSDLEYPVAYADSAYTRLYGRLESFSKWLEILIEERREVIRTLYGDDVIYDELGLG